MKVELTVQKGKEMSRLRLLKNLTLGLDELFKVVPIEHPDVADVTFGNTHKIVSKYNFKATLIIEKL